MEEFYMVDGPAQGEIVEKKSRFIANVFPVDSEEQALEIIEKTKKQYWDARHNCFAFVIGKNNEVQRTAFEPEERELTIGRQKSRHRCSCCCDLQRK